MAGSSASVQPTPSQRIRRAVKYACVTSVRTFTMRSMRAKNATRVSRSVKCSATRLSRWK
jgi:hypothetical protein